jgi:hypothetical protein
MIAAGIASTHTLRGGRKLLMRNPIEFHSWACVAATTAMLHFEVGTRWAAAALLLTSAATLATPLLAYYAMRAEQPSARKHRLDVLYAVLRMRHTPDDHR